MSKINIFLTCEHGGAEIPEPYRQLFKKNRNILKTHRALDIGALEIAKFLKYDYLKAKRMNFFIDIIIRIEIHF